MRKILYLLFLSSFLSCEDIITPNLPTNDPILVVDAWVNNLNQPQKIFLSTTQDYLDSTSSPSVTGAVIKVGDDLGNVYEFVESDAGEYVWQPDSKHKNLGVVGTSYMLSIAHLSLIHISEPTRPY